MVDLASILMGVGAGALLGFVVGFALRKILGIIMFAIGVFVMGLIILVHNGVATVNFDALQRLLADLFLWGLKTGNQAIDNVFSGTPFTMGLLAGLGLGLFRSGGLKFLELPMRKVRRVLRIAEEGE
ncbi:MAG: hypothetical protein DRJ38_01925 [Thermoprotei archaeon]|nr:MAG: hypothetical protein DRJ38_01925 [Thermoprotei archaeon]